MDKEPKYYTPSIEEFYIGFEYEITNGYEWINKIFSKDDLKSFLYDKLENGIIQKYIRVKYLDKKDIKSLGFKEQYCYINTFRNDDIYKKGSVQIELDFKKSVLITVFYHPKEYSEEYFIKNKTELKKLLTQKKINYNDTTT